MNESAGLEAAWHDHHPYLVNLAYRMLGDIGEAEDVAQEAFLRLARADQDQLDDVRAWLTVVAGRLSLDVLRSARARLEHLDGSAALGTAAAADADPADRVTLDEQVTTALLVVLERLSPAERTAFVLHDVFGLGFPEVAEVVGRSPAAVRQLAARARRHVDDGTPRFPASREQQTEIVAAFAAAWQLGDVDGLVGVLDPEVVLTSDGGGIVVATRKPIAGGARVAEVLAGFTRAARLSGRRQRGGLAEVNGRPGLVVSDGTVMSVMSFTIDAGRIVAIDIVRNPEKLRHVDADALALTPEQEG